MPEDKSSTPDMPEQNPETGVGTTPAGLDQSGAEEGAPASVGDGRVAREGRRC